MAVVDDILPPEGYASSDLHDWRRGFGVFAVERFVEAARCIRRDDASATDPWMLLDLAAAVATML